MNLVLTKACAKECSFCFTGAKTEGYDMDVALVKELIENNPDEQFSLIGGEPTQHPDFIEILGIASSVKHLLITNLLFPRKIQDAIVSSSVPIILANGMELDEKNRITLFSRNWNVLVDANKRMTLALTITEHATVEQFEKYMDFLKSKLNGLDYLRIGLDLSSDYLINNTYLGDIILAIQKKLPTAHITFDCQVPACIFDYDTNKFLYDYVDLFSYCNNPAVDVFNDGSAIHCYQKQDMKIDDVTKYSASSLAKKFRVEYKKEEKKQTLPLVCQECEHYLTNNCLGLCLGCSKSNNSIEITSIV